MPCKDRKILHTKALFLQKKLKKASSMRSENVKFAKTSQNSNTYTMQLIADSGSTKTAWLLLHTDGQKRTIFTQGLNPYQQTPEEMLHILQHELIPALQGAESSIRAVHFYGAGCTPEKSPLVSDVLRNALRTSAPVHVESDMLGAARALCQQQPGIVAILGTGSNSAYYDGHTLHSLIPALGFILGDEGSGAYIGKRLVGDVFKQQLPADLRQQFLTETGETMASIIQKVYRTPLPNRFLASLSPFCSRHIQHPAIQAFLTDCFDQFFQRNILPALQQPELSSFLSGHTPIVHFAGSIAYHYAAPLRQAAIRNGILVGNILSAPLEQLAVYHQREREEE